MTVKNTRLPTDIRGEPGMKGGRWIAFSGSAYVLAWIIGLAIGLATSSPGPTDSISTIGAYFASHREVAMLQAYFLDGLAGASLIVFAAALRSGLRRFEGESAPLSSILLGAGVAAGTVSLLQGLFTQVLADHVAATGHERGLNAAVLRSLRATTTGGRRPWPATHGLGLQRPDLARHLGATEEATYLGYTLPRLEALLGNTAVSAALVSAIWALQHESLPLLPDGRYLLYRALSALPVTFTTTLLYLLRGRRLPPLIVMHWASDAASALFAALPQRRVDGTSTR